MHGRPANAVDGVDLGVSLAAASMVALANNAVVVNNYGTDHGVGSRVHPAVASQLDAALHIGFVKCHAVFYLNKSQ